MESTAGINLVFMSYLLMREQGDDRWLHSGAGYKYEAQRYYAKV